MSNYLSNAPEVITQKVVTVDGDVTIYSNFFTPYESEGLFLELLNPNNISWQQDSIKLFGQSKPLPRLTAWYGDSDKKYTYSGITMNPKPWTSLLLGIKQRIEILTEVKFNSVLLNLYRDGKDSVSWHSDDEPELGLNPVIASVSFGETRQFMMKHKYKKDLAPIQLDLTSGSCLMMKGETQHFWKHQIPKTNQPVKERINLTFRVIGKQ